MTPRLLVLLLALLPPAARAAGGVQYVRTLFAATELPALASAELGVSDNDDSPVEDFALPFEFPFFGEAFTGLRVSPNGGLLMGYGGAPCGCCFQGFGCSLDDGYRGIVAPLVSDWNPARFANSLVLGGASAEAAAFAWSSVPRFGDDSHFFSFAAELFPSGRVRLSLVEAPVAALDLELYAASVLFGLRDFSDDAETPLAQTAALVALSYEGADGELDASGVGAEFCPMPEELCAEVAGDEVVVSGAAFGCAESLQLYCAFDGDLNATAPALNATADLTVLTCALPANATTVQMAYADPSSGALALVPGSAALSSADACEGVADWLEDGCGSLFERADCGGTCGGAHVDDGDECCLASELDCWGECGGAARSYATGTQTGHVCCTAALAGECGLCSTDLAKDLDACLYWGDWADMTQFAIVFGGILGALLLMFSILFCRRRRDGDLRGIELFVLERARGGAAAAAAAEPAGVSDATMAVLPRVLFSESATPADEDPQCPLCLESYLPSDVLRVFPCKHRFHDSCIGMWAERSRSCPMCRQDVESAVESSGVKPAAGGPPPGSAGATSATVCPSPPGGGGRVAAVGRPAPI